MTLVMKNSTVGPPLLLVPVPVKIFFTLSKSPKIQTLKNLSYMQKVCVKLNLKKCIDTLFSCNYLAPTNCSPDFRLRVLQILFVILSIESLIRAFWFTFQCLSLIQPGNLFKSVFYQAGKFEVVILFFCQGIIL